MPKLDLDPYAAVLVQEAMTALMLDGSSPEPDKAIAAVVYEECEKALHHESERVDEAQYGPVYRPFHRR